MAKTRRKCGWCGSSKHQSQHCRIKAKHGRLLEGCTPHEAGFVVLDCVDMNEAAEKIDAIHTLLT